MGKVLLIIKNKIENFVSYTSDACVAKVKAKLDGQVERCVYLKSTPNLNYIPS